MPTLIRRLFHVLAGIALLSGVLVIADATVASAVPVVRGVSPNSGPATGGTNITITGTGFVPGARVRIGQGDGVVTAIAATNVVFVSSTELTATTEGPAIAGLFNVFVTQNGGITNNGYPFGPIYFTYTPVGPAPTITNITPNSGPVSGGTAVTITGTGFSNPENVFIWTAVNSPPEGYIPGLVLRMSNVVMVSSTEITATTGQHPNGAAWKSILYVAGTGGTSAAGPASDFNYAPTVTSVSPNTGPTSGGTTITIMGSGFEDSFPTVLIGQGNGTTGAIAATTVQVGSTEITATTGGGATAGTFPVFVKTNGVTSPASTAADFTYTG
jgi:hypothetical protein